MSENKDNKLTLINEKTANDYLTHTRILRLLTKKRMFAIITLVLYVIISDVVRRVLNGQNIVNFYCFL